ncbi:MAG: gamma carbonic anhydrase family protein [Pseudomonadota bacterium]
MTGIPWQDRDFGAGVTLKNPAFIHPTALLYGDITVEEGASIWPYVVIRAESAPVVIGPNTNIQDFVMIHTSPGFPTHIGANVSVTHHCTVHACTVGDDCLIGINATIFDGAHIGHGSTVGQHAYVRDGARFDDHSVIVGSPAKAIKTVDGRLMNRMNAALYRRNAEFFAIGRHDAWRGKEFEAFMADTMQQLQSQLAG